MSDALPTIEELPRYLRLLQTRTWRLSQLPREITRDVLIVLDRFKLIEVRLAILYLPGRKRDVWYVCSTYPTNAGSLEEILLSRDYQGDAEPEFRLSPEGLKSLLRETAKLVRQPDGTALADPILVVDVVKAVGRKAGRSDKLADRMKRRNYPVEKRAGKWHCQRADAIAMFPRHRSRIEGI